MGPSTRLVPGLPAGGNVARAIAAMHRVLAAIGWDASEGEASADPSSLRVVVDFGPPHRPIADAVMAIEPEAQCFVASFNFGGTADASTRDEVARFAARANWELLAGNFELDLESGAVRFRSSVPFGGGELPPSIIRGVIRTAMQVVEAYAEALVDVMDGHTGADEALERVWRAAAGRVDGDA